MNDTLIQSGKERDFFAAIQAMQETPEDTRTVEAAKAIRKSVMSFMARPAIEARKAVQAFTTKADLPTMITQTFDAFRQTDNFDMLWEQAYKQIPLAPNRLFWEILDIDSGLEFVEVPEGAQIQVNAISGSKVYGHVRKYGGAIDWSQEMIISQDIGAMQQVAETLREKFWKDKANRHYSLMATNGLGNQDTYVGSQSVDNDILALNNSAFALANNAKNEGFGDTANAPMILYASPFLRPRILRAIATTFQDVPGMAARVVYNITPLFTFNPYLTSPAGTSNPDWALLVLPGRKIQRAEAMAPTSFTRQDIQTLGSIQAVWSFYGALIGKRSDQNVSTQIRIVKFA